jgi:hypothetical protein
MPWKILLSCVAMLLLAGSAMAADINVLAIPQSPEKPEQTPPNVMYLQATPDLTLPYQSEDRLDPDTGDLERSLLGRSGQYLIADPPAVQLHDVLQLRTPSEYWLGVECYPAPTVLRVHLNLPENQGLLVARIVPESPAAKAGLEENDILMQVGETKLGNVPDLLKIVDSAKESPLELEIIHAGKAKAVKVTAEKRPANMMFRQEGNPSDWNQIQDWMKSMQSGASAAQPQRLRLQVIQPGAILPPGAPAEPPMPGNMSININRNGDEPAKITVKWNDKQWETTEKKLDELPAEVRPFVERMLGHGRIQTMTFGGGGAAAGGISAEAMDFTIPAPPPGFPGAQGLQMQIRPFRSLDDRLEELSRKIDQLQKDVHEHWGQQPPPAAENVKPDSVPEPADEPAK